MVNRRSFDFVSFKYVKDVEIPRNCRGRSSSHCSYFTRLDVPFGVLTPLFPPCFLSVYVFSICMEIFYKPKVKAIRLRLVQFRLFILHLFKSFHL